MSEGIDSLEDGIESLTIVLDIFFDLTHTKVDISSFVKGLDQSIIFLFLLKGFNDFFVSGNQVSVKNNSWFLFHIWTLNLESLLNIYLLKIITKSSQNLSPLIEILQSLVLITTNLTK